MAGMSDEFVVGGWWTPERARDAVARMTATYDSPPMQAVLDQIASGFEEGGPEGAVEHMPEQAPPPAPATLTGPVTLERCTFRRGRLSDIPRFAELLMAANLPPMFIEEFIEGFAVAECEGVIVGIGGLEMYETSGVIRSIVADERARGTGLGRRIADLLAEDAVAAGAEDLYLFTLDAHDFWLHLGYKDVPLSAWKQPPRASWQYRFIERFADAAGNPFSMWRPAR